MSYLVDNLRAVPEPDAYYYEVCFKTKANLQLHRVFLQASADLLCGRKGWVRLAWGARVQLFGLLKAWGERPLIAMS